MASSGGPRDFQRLYPYDQLVAGIQALFDLLFKVTNLVIGVYQQIRPDIARYCNVYNVQQLSPQAVDTIRRVFTTLLNMTRFFNPRRFSSFESIENARPKSQPLSVLVQLVSRISRMVGYMKERYESLFTEMRPIIERIRRTIPEQDESLWNDLLAYQARLLAFTLDVLNPELFAHLQV